MQRRDQVRGVPAARRRLGVDFVATGSLRAERGDAGRRVASPARRRRRTRTSRTCCTCSASGQLARSLFPVGGDAEDGDARARRAVGSAGGAKPDSQELCFAPSGRRRRVRPPAAPAARSRGRRSLTSRARGSRRTTGRSPSRSASARARGRNGRAAPTSSRWTRREPRGRRARTSCCRGGGWWPIACVGRGGAAGRRSVRGGGPDPVPGRRRAGRGRAARGRPDRWSSARRSEPWRRGRAR